MRVLGETLQRRGRAISVVATSSRTWWWASSARRSSTKALHPDADAACSRRLRSAAEAACTITLWCGPGLVASRLNHHPGPTPVDITAALLGLERLAMEGGHLMSRATRARISGPGSGEQLCQQRVAATPPDGEPFAQRPRRHRGGGCCCGCRRPGS